VSWVTHLSPTAADGAFLCNTLSVDGVRKTLPVHEMPFVLSDRQESLKVVLRSKLHGVDDISQYLDLMRWNSLPTGGQTLHTFDTSKGDVWIPSQLLVQALFAFNVPLAKLLFRPIPVECFCAPVLEDSDNQITFPDRALFRQNYKRDSSVLQRLAWMAHSRSAQRAWGSVFRNALDGRLDCTMPEGEFEVSVRGKRVHGIFCVARMTIFKVTCDDIYTREHNTTQTFAFRKRAEPFDRNSVPIREVLDSTFIEVREHLLKNQALPEHGKATGDDARLRRNLNLIRTKLVHPCKWPQLPGHHRDVASAFSLYTRLRRANHLEDVKRLLLEAQPG
jgi:hypothetical protein